MKLSKSEYEALIRKHPNLRPTDGLKSQNTHKTLIEELEEVCTLKNYKLPMVTQNLVKTPRTLKFTIPGQPVGKPRMSQQDKWRKRPCVVKYWEWADKARASVPTGTLLGIYREVHFKAYLEFPKSYSKTKRELLIGQPHLQKPDIDNIAKSCGDALFYEDKLIWKFSGEKRWNDGQGARIEIELK